MTQVIYIGAHPGVSSHAFAGVAQRHGEPIDVDSDVAEALIARGDFLRFKPEPVRGPVQTTKEQ